MTRHACRLSGTPPFYSNTDSSKLDAGMIRSIKRGEFEFDDEKWDVVSEEGLLRVWRHVCLLT